MVSYFQLANRFFFSSFDFKTHTIPAGIDIGIGFALKAYGDANFVEQQVNKRSWFVPSLLSNEKGVGLRRKIMQINGDYTLLHFL